MATALLHIGKRTEEAKTKVSQAMHDRLADLARKADCTPSDIVLDAIYMAVTGKSFAEHVADDRRAVMRAQWLQQGDKGAGA